MLSIRRASVPLSILVLIFVMGCTGQVFLTPEEEVTPGEALGFDFIHYFQRTTDDPSDINETLSVFTDGDMHYTVFDVEQESTLTSTKGFLSDIELIQLLQRFNESGFFQQPGSFGEGTLDKQSISYQVAGTNHQIVRYGDAEVPLEIEDLFARLQMLMEWYGEGLPLPVSPFVDGTSTRINEGSYFAVKSEDALLDLLWRIGSVEISVLPPIDFSSEMLVCAFIGDNLVQDLWPGTTVSISFDDVAYERNGSLKARYTRHNVPLECARDVRPFAIAKLPRSDMPVQFFEETVYDSTATCR